MANNYKDESWKHMQLSLKWNLELKLGSNTYPDFDVIFKVLLVIFLRQFISRSHESNAWNDLQIGTEMKKLWSSKDNYVELKDSFEMISKFNLWFWNPFQNYPNCEIKHYHFKISPHLPQKLHLGHSVRPKWALHDWKPWFYYFFSYF